MIHEPGDLPVLQEIGFLRGKGKVRIMIGETLSKALITHGGIKAFLRFADLNG